MIQRLAYYVTAHGYGHGARSTDILNALHREQPDLEITVVTELPEWFLQSRLNFTPFEIRARAFDVGMVQLDSVQVDLRATAQRLETLLAQWDSLVEEEEAWLEQSCVEVLVADIPGIPIEAGRRLKLPSYAVGNFSWDWIYEEFEGQGEPWVSVIEKFKQAYRQTTQLFQLPFSCPMKSFPQLEEVPLVSLPGEELRAALSVALDIPQDSLWVLLSFTTLDLCAEAREKISSMQGYSFLTIKPLEWGEPNFYSIDPKVWAVPDLFASVDVVLTKPGYGVLSDCAVNKKPIIYVERSDFRETPYLIAALEKHFQQWHLPAEKLYAGDLEEALQGIQNQSRPNDPVVFDGGAAIARSVLQGSS